MLARRACLGRPWLAWERTDWLRRRACRAIFADWIRRTFIAGTFGIRATAGRCYDDDLINWVVTRHSRRRSDLTGGPPRSGWRRRRRPEARPRPLFHRRQAE